MGSTSSAIEKRILESMDIFKLNPVLNESKSSYPSRIILTFSTFPSVFFGTTLIALCVCFILLFLIMISSF